MRKAFLALGLMAAASSSSFAWSTVGAGCVPAGQTTQSDLPFQTAGRTRFNTGKIGEIILTCPIEEAVGANNFYLSYIDPDGLNTGAHVQATLRRLNRRTGEVVSLQALHSNRSAATGWNVLTAGVGSGCFYRFDPANYYYYVQINMKRTSILQAVGFGGVGLETVVC